MLHVGVPQPPCPLVSARLVESFGNLDAIVLPTVGRPALESALSANFLHHVSCGEGTIPNCSCRSDRICPLWLEAATEILESAALTAPLPLPTDSDPDEAPHAVDPSTAAWSAVDSPTRWAQWDERAERRRRYAPRDL